MADVFISHSSVDHLIAEQLCAQLEARGISCWMAPRDIRPGEEWAKAINEAISSSSVFIVIYSKNSAQSTQVPKEIGLAGARKSYIIPYKIDDTPLNGEFEYYLLGSHWIIADVARNDLKINELYNVISAYKMKLGQPPMVNQVHVTEIHDSEVRYYPEKKKSAVPIIIAAMISLVIIICTIVIVFVVNHNKDSDSGRDKDSVSDRLDEDEDEDEDEDDKEDNDKKDKETSEEAENSASEPAATTSSTTASTTSDIVVEQQPETYTIWDGTVDTSWYNRSSSSFEISTAEQLAGLAKLVNNGNDMSGVTIYLKNNIYLNDDWGNYSLWKASVPANVWVPIGKPSAPFKGTFNGNNMVICGLYTDASNANVSGWFGSAENAEITQLCLWYGLVNAVVTDDRQCLVGGLVGDITDSTISKIDVAIQVNASTNTNTAFAGGVMGYATNCIIYNIINRFYVGAVSQCVSDEIYGAIAGGIAGCLEQNCYIENVINGAYVYAESRDNLRGGVIGNFYTPDNTILNVTNCYYAVDENDSTYTAAGETADADIYMTGVTLEEMYSQGMADKLGDAFIFSDGNIYLK